MLVEFSVENYRSIRGEARISLVAGSGKEHYDRNIATPELNPGVRAIRLLPVVAIYGANASGKTNLIRALAAMREIVCQSSSSLKELPVVPFAFHPESLGEPSTFEVVGIVNRMRFQYGFAVRADVVHREWLYAWPRGRAQLWFDRRTIGDSDEVHCLFGDKLLGDKEVWRRATRRNALLLSTAVMLNSDQLRQIFDWFNDNLHIAGIGGWDRNFSLGWCAHEGTADIVRFLRAADSGINDLRVDQRDFAPEMLPDDMPAELRERMARDLTGGKVVNVRCFHHPRNSGPKDLDLNDESHGTQKMFSLAAPWIDTLRTGQIIVFDKLHDNLHPLLVRFLVELFHDPKENSLGAQLVFTTHDTSILSQDVFRRDQIWFCERNAEQESTVFPLTDFRPRRGVENLERSYLAGRYGAIPHFSPFGCPESSQSD